MLRILIATHGSLAPALLASANMVYGELPAVVTVSLTEEGGIEAFRAEFEQTLRRHGAGSDGVLVLCDPRLTQKSYGRVFLESLPPLPITRALADIQAFFATPPQA